jgi:ankyrin repeat protein
MNKRLLILALALAVGAGASRSLAQQATSPVADAARKGDQAAIVALLKKGADANAPHADGMTPLMAFLRSPLSNIHTSG